MCGRFGLTRPERLDLQRFGVAGLPPVEARFNIPPGTPILVVRERDGERTAGLVHWGLVPSWAKDADIGRRLTNARADSAFEKPSFRNAMRSRRCLIPADVFYEWQLVPGEKRKQPHAIRRRDGEPFAIGGLWEYWTPKDAAGESLVSCAILTTDANAHMSRIHDRMPVIVPAEDYSAWLDPRTPQPAVQALTLPSGSEELESWPIGSAVNNPRNDTPGVLEPLESGSG